MSDDEDSFVASDSEEEESSKKKKKSPKKSPKKTEKAEKKSPAKKKSTSNKENEKASSASKKRDKDTPKPLSDKEAGPRLIEYLREQNRPFNALGLFENLKQTIKKPVLQKLLDKYTEQGILTCKLNGKQKLYFIAQDPKLILSDEVLAQKDEEIKQLDIDLKEQTQLANKATQEWNALKNEPTTEELTKMVSNKETSVTQMKNKLTQLTAGNVPTISREEMNKLNTTFEYYLSAWKKRKKICVDYILGLFEYAEDTATTEERLASVGMDTDEDNNIDINTYQSLVLPVIKKGSVALGGCKRLKTS